MTRQEFRELCEKKILILDGATGSNLQRRGMPQGVCPELWITEHPQALMDLQREYIEAGSDIVYAPTFGANRIKLAEYGLEDRLEELNQTLVHISKEAADGQALVAADITMTGAQLEPMGDLTFDQLVEVYREQVQVLAQAGADLVVVETMLSLQETRAAVQGAREACDLPVMATLSFQGNGMTLYGVSAASAAVVLQGMGVDAVGVNCSAGPDEMAETVRMIRQAATIPVIAKPNAGLPKLRQDGTAEYDMSAEEFAGHMEALIQAGASIVGGCCGTAPEYIRLLSQRVKGESSFCVDAHGVTAADGESAGEKSALHDSVPEQAQKILLATERSVYEFAPGQKLSVGRDIDFSANPELVEEYQEDCFDTALDLAFDQEDCDILCLSAKAGGVDEGEALLALAQELSGSVGAPFLLSSDSPEALKHVIQHFPGIMAVQWSHGLEGSGAEIKNIAQSYRVPIVTLDNEINYC